MNRNSRGSFFAPVPSDERRLSPRRDPLAGPGPWIAFVVGLLIMLLASILRADDAIARRTDRFNATLPPRSTLRVENVSGDVIVSGGREFSAVCNTTVTAPTQDRADEALSKTRVVQSRDGDELALETEWPEMERARQRDRSKGYVWRGKRSARCPDCRINIRFDVVVPPGVVAVLHTVNGEVRVQGVDGQLQAQTVNGNVIVRGSRRDVRAQTVNGKVEVAADAAPAGSNFELKTISGSVSLVLPKDARFDLTASTMNGSIESNFPLPPQASPIPPETPETPKPETPRAVRTPRRVVIQRDGNDAVLDVEQLQKELEESMKAVDVQVRESMREVERETRRMKFVIPGGEYRGSIGEGGAKVRLSNLNGRIAVLAAGAKESEVRQLLGRRTWTVRVPSVPVPAPQVRVFARPGAVHERHRGADPDEEIVKGDVAGDFVATEGAGSYRLGRVSGKVTILTHSGEIHVAAASGPADLKSYGGDIEIGPVGGELRAQTLAGDIHAGRVSGAVVAQTSGGDIRIGHAVGSAEAKTAGGDIVLQAVEGSVRAETGGGEVRVTILTREPRGGISIRNAGGDVTLVVPANFKGDLDLTALDADLDETAIRSDFPEIAVTRRSGSQQASGSLNGGGPKVTVRTSSGSIRIRKGPPAGS
ncbi:MAG TPA: DUF4097 family beta strand repeat-containing protein [Thermoanaerobaculia bacterium]|nr:DUF4097 family beta strand repeat-containing protein [Thermoanaerobaculia bacterium]